MHRHEHQYPDMDLCQVSGHHQYRMLTSCVSIWVLVEVEVLQIGLLLTFRLYFTVYNMMIE